jgi:hypothetical protein
MNMGLWRLRVLVSSYVALLLICGIERAIAAPNTVARKATCPKSLDHGSEWRPTQLELSCSLARHAGWCVKNYVGVSLPQSYGFIERTLPDWRDEARDHPQRADLRHAVLSANLSANLRGANLIGADLSFADLRERSLLAQTCATRIWTARTWTARTWTLATCAAAA